MAGQMGPKSPKLKPQKPTQQTGGEGSVQHTNKSGSIMGEKYSRI